VVAYCILQSLYSCVAKGINYSSNLCKYNIFWKFDFLFSLWSFRRTILFWMAADLLNYTHLVNITRKNWNKWEFKCIYLDLLRSLLRSELLSRSLSRSRSRSRSFVRSRSLSRSRSRSRSFSFSRSRSLSLSRSLLSRSRSRSLSLSLRSFSISCLSFSFLPFSSSSF